MKKEKTVIPPPADYDRNIPLSLKDSENLYYKSEKFFNEDNFKTVECYYHSTNLGWIFPINMHSHEFFEINIIVGGHGVHYINGDRLKTHIGDVFIITPNTPHGYYEINDMEVFHILLSEKFFNKFGDELNKMNGFVTLFDIEPKLRSSKINDSFLHLNKDFFNNVLSDINNLLLYSKPSIYNNNIQTAIVFQIICKFCECYVQQTSHNAKNKSAYSSTILNIMEYMKRNLSRKITIDDLTKMSFFSRSSFERFFNEVANVSPMKYLNTLRISAAKQMLKNTNHTIAFIANECGFFDSSHFEKQFCRHEGITPTAYRNLFKQ